MKVSEFFEAFGATLKSIVKVALLSRRPTVHNSHPSGPLIVLANGPSLNETMASSMETLKAHDTMSVNFAPLADVFFDIRPKYHVLADPLFFAEGDDAPFNVKALYEAFQRVDWPLTLLVPVKFASAVRAKTQDNSHITVATFNCIGAEGFGWFRNLVYSRRLAMPRPRNVLIPALMNGIWIGYKDLYIVGADHSWMQTISVDSDNNVISVQPHFYHDDKREQQRVDTTYRGYRLHQIVHSFYVAFRSYHTLQAFATTRSIHIYNSTPTSFIDAFPRRPLP